MACSSAPATIPTYTDGAMLLVPDAPFGPLLKSLRESAGLSQRDLARRASYSVVYVGMLERGDRAPTSLTVDLLAGALELGPDERTALRDAGRRVPRGRSGPYPYTGALPSLVGRVAELALLDRHLAGEGPPVLVLAGEPGIGKTRLLYEAIERGCDRWWTVLYGSCQRRSPRDLYSPLREALGDHVQSLSPDELRVYARDCPWVARVLPELALAGVVEAPAPLLPERERRLVFAAMVRFVANVAGSAGTLLVLDDLQWAGPDALEVLLALAHAAARTPIRIVCAYRGAEARPSAALGATLAELAEAGLTLHHTVPPLARSEARRMLEGLAPHPATLRPALRDQLVQRSAGVPFFITSLAQGMTGDPSEAPWDLAQSLRQRVAALPDPARELLDAAAVVGREARHDVLMALTSRPRDEALDALESACRTRLLEEDGDTVRFAHDVIREVVEADLDAARRQMLHRRVAEMLEGMIDPSSTSLPSMDLPSADLLAYHYGRSDAPDRALVYLERAADEAHAQSAHAAAADRFGVLMDRLAALGRTGDAARVGEKRGAVLSAMGRYDDAVAVLDDVATAHLNTGDIDGFGRVTAGIAHAYARRGTPNQGVERIEGCLPVLTGAGATRGLAAAYAALAHLYWLSGRYEEQAAAAAWAADAARAVGDDVALAAAEGRRGVALYGQGRFDEALAVLEDAARLAEAVGDLETLWRALTNIATIHFTRGEFGRCQVLDERLLGVVRRQNDPVAIARVLTNRGDGALYSGEWARARADFEEALALVRGIGDTEATVYPLLDLAFLSLLEGRWDELASLDEAARLAERTGDLQALRWLGTMRAELDIRRGYPEQARARFTSLLDRSGLEEADVTYILPLLAWAYLEEGNLEEAAAVAARAVDRARVHEHRVVLVDALRVDALVSCRAGRRDEAASLLDEGLALARAMPYPVAEARLLHVYGEVEGLATDGPPGSHAARERLEAALALYERLGARQDAADAREDLAALPYRGHLLANGIAPTHGQWARIAEIVGPAALAPRGRPRADGRRTVAAILYVQRTGCRWAALPPEFGDDATAHRRYKQWRADETWARIGHILALD